MGGVLRHRTAKVSRLPLDPRQPKVTIPEEEELRGVDQRKSGDGERIILSLSCGIFWAKINKVPLS